MIVIKNHKPQIPLAERTIGCKRDNDTQKRIFKLPRYIDDLDLSEFSPVIEIQPVTTTDLSYYNLLSMTFDETTITLVWNIKAHDTKANGKLYFNIFFGLNVDENTTKIYQSQMDYFEVADSVDGKQQAEILTPNFIEQGVTQVSNLVHEATQQANKAETNANLVTEVKEQVIVLEQSASSSSAVANEAKDDIILRQQDIAQKHTEVVSKALEVTDNTTQVSMIKNDIDSIKTDIDSTANSVVLDKNLVLEMVDEVSTNADYVSNVAVEVRQQHADVIEKTIEIENNANIASASATIALQSKTNANESEYNAKTSEINAKISEDNAKESEENAKLSEINAKNSENVAIENAAISLEQAQISTNYADISVDQANAASINKDATDDAVNDVNRMRLEIDLMMQYVNGVYSNCLGVLGQQQSLLSTVPYFWIRDSIEAMNTITTMKDGDFCIVFSGEFNAQGTYRYFVNDIDGNPLTQPAWVWLTDLSLINLTQEYLLGILNLSTSAVSGSYNDLIDKPNRYESFITLPDGNWDYSISDKVIVSSATALNITNVYNGAVGLIRAYAEPILPANSKYSEDFNDIEASQYIYMFVYDGANFIWTRSGINA